MAWAWAALGVHLQGLFVCLFGGLDIALFEIHGAKIYQRLVGQWIEFNRLQKFPHGIVPAAGLSIDEAEMVVGHHRVRQFLAFFFEFFDDLVQIFFCVTLLSWLYLK